MFKCWKSLLNLRTDGGECRNEGETEVADDGTPQQATTVVVAMDIGRHVDGDVGGPRHPAEEVHEPHPDVRHVEAEDKRQRNQVGEIVTVDRHLVELPTQRRTSQVTDKG